MLFSEEGFTIFGCGKKKIQAHKATNIDKPVQLTLSHCHYRCFGYFNVVISLKYMPRKAFLLLY